MHVPMIKQDLAARAEGYLEGTDFLVFSPVVGITFQPELQNRMVGDAWLVRMFHDPITKTDPTLLVDARTGEVHFYGGRFEIIGSSGVTKSVAG